MHAGGGSPGPGQRRGVAAVAVCLLSALLAATSAPQLRRRPAPSAPTPGGATAGAATPPAAPTTDWLSKAAIVQTSARGFPHSDAWQEQNPGSVLHLFDDAEAADFVARRAAPEVAAAYKALPLAVERADLFRYIAVGALGGVYADSDVEPYVPVSEWLARMHWPPSTRPDAVIGVEFYRPKVRACGGRNYSVPLQLVQWVFAARRASELLRAVVREVLLAVRQVQGTEDDCVQVRTGPQVWTRAVLRFIAQHSGGADPTPHGPLPRVLGPAGATRDALAHRGMLLQLGPERLLLLPYRAFGFHQLHRDSYASAERNASHQRLARHWFEGSWRGHGLASK
eukprot:TRINITY_DN31965_c0_g1_i1.p1 TRINITY_DN31965_c0_g1~~TRINITY_DN31965_c0_g1_i1.p1  ORF type:complete len:364 (+),score=68.40 TRINITY_DN31965_c0_g1_i1:74-1093(+)